MTASRRCPEGKGCGETFPATTEYFYVRARRADGTPRLDGFCKDCRKRMRREKYWADPKTARKRQRKMRAKRRAEDPAFAAAERAYYQTWQERTRKNRALRERHRQTKRMSARLIRERAGGEPFSLRVIPPDVLDERGIGGYDPQPVADFLRRIHVQTPDGWRGLERLTGYDEAFLRRIATGEQGRIQGLVADRILTRAGRPDLFAVHYG